MKHLKNEAAQQPRSNKNKNNKPKEAATKQPPWFELNLGGEGSRQGKLA